MDWRKWHKRSGVALRKPHVRNPVAAASVESITNTFTLEVCGRTGESELFGIVKCIGVHDGIQMAVDITGDKRDDPATFAYVKHGGCRAKLILGDLRLISDVDFK